MLRYLLSFFTGILLTANLHGQITKTLHQTFQTDGAPKLELQLVDEYEIEFWPGNNVLVETKVELYDASPAILDFFVNQKLRYQIDIDDSGPVLHISSHDPKRVEIQHKGQKCYEFVRIRLFIPDIYEQTAEHVLELKNRLKTQDQKKKEAENG